MSVGFWSGVGGAVGLLFLILSGCTDGKGSGEGEGEGEGEGLLDHGDCDAYIQCETALGDPTAVLEATYGEDGTCWGGTQDDITLCKAQCTDALNQLSEAYPDEAACNGMIANWGCEDEPTGNGYSVGNTAPDFTLYDQYGAPISLYDFCGAAVVLVVGATWDGVTGAVAIELQGWLEDYGDDGLVGVVLMGEGDGSDGPETEELWDFAHTYGLEAPVLADPDYEVGTSYTSGTIPSVNLIAPGGEILIRDGLRLDAEDIEAALP